MTGFLSYLSSRINKKNILLDIITFIIACIVIFILLQFENMEQLNSINDFITFFIEKRFKQMDCFNRIIEGLFCGIFIYFSLRILLKKKYLALLFSPILFLDHQFVKIAIYRGNNFMMLSIFSSVTFSYFIYKKLAGSPLLFTILVIICGIACSLATFYDGISSILPITMILLSINSFLMGSIPSQINDKHKNDTKDNNESDDKIKSEPSLTKIIKVNFKRYIYIYINLISMLSIWIFVYYFLSRQLCKLNQKNTLFFDWKRRKTFSKLFKNRNALVPCLFVFGYIIKSKNCNSQFVSIFTLASLFLPGYSNNDFSINEIKINEFKCYLLISVALMCSKTKNQFYFLSIYIATVILSLFNRIKEI